MANSSRKLVSPVGRLSFPALFVPEVNQNNPSATAKYSTIIVFDKDTDIAPLEEIIAEAREAKFGQDVPSNFRNPIRDGSEKAHLGEPFQVELPTGHRRPRPPAGHRPERGLSRSLRSTPDPCLWLWHQRQQRCRNWPRQCPEGQGRRRSRRSRRCVFRFRCSRGG